MEQSQPLLSIEEEEEEQEKTPLSLFIFLIFFFVSLLLLLGGFHCSNVDDPRGMYGNRLSTVQLVIAHSYEDLTWLTGSQPWNISILIYTKTLLQPGEIRLSHDDWIVTIGVENDAGRECTPFLYHFMTAYDDFANVTITMHGHGLVSSGLQAISGLIELQRALNTGSTNTSDLTKRIVRDLHREPGMTSYPHQYRTRCFSNHNYFPFLLPRTVILLSSFFPKGLQLLSQYDSRAKVYYDYYHSHGEICMSTHCCTEFVISKERLRRIPRVLYSQLRALILQETDQYLTCEDIGHLFFIMWGMRLHQYGINIKDIFQKSLDTVRRIIGPDDCPYVLEHYATTPPDDSESRLSCLASEKTLIHENEKSPGENPPPYIHQTLPL